MAEWSKALVLGTSPFGGVGSNPTAAKIYVFVLLVRNLLQRRDSNPAVAKFYVLGLLVCNLLQSEAGELNTEVVLYSHTQNKKTLEIF